MFVIFNDQMLVVVHANRQFVRLENLSNRSVVRLRLDVLPWPCAENVRFSTYLNERR